MEEQVALGSCITGRRRLAAFALLVGMMGSILAVDLPAQSARVGGSSRHGQASGLVGAGANPSLVRASYTTYGTGCPGTGLGPNISNSLNTATSSGALIAQTLGGEYCYGVTVQQSAVILGFRLFTRRGATTTPPVTTDCALYLQDPFNPQRPTATSTASGTMEVGTASGLYEIYLDRPVPVTAGTNVWISQYDTVNVLPAARSSGATSTLPTYFRRMAGGTGRWTSTNVIQFPAWELICHGGPPGASPVLAFQGVPRLGGSFDILLRHAPPNTQVYLFWGLSKTTWSGLTLPFSLGPLGPPGCTILASGELKMGGGAPFLTGPFGDYSLHVPVLNLPSINGATLYNQWVVLDLAVSTPILPITFSNGADCNFGT